MADLAPLAPGRLTRCEGSAVRRSPQLGPRLGRQPLPPWPLPSPLPCPWPLPLPLPLFPLLAPATAEVGGVVGGVVVGVFAGAGTVVVVVGAGKVSATRLACCT